MGNMVPKIQRHKKSPKKDNPPATFLYSHMVRIHKVNSIHDHYHNLQKINTATTGSIFKAIGNTNPHIRALKQIKKQGGSGVSSLLEMQFAILKTLDHPNIVKMYQILQTPTHIYIVTQLCQGQELFDLLIKQKHLPQKSARQIIFQIVSALNHMHQHNFMHRDIKPENIMYNPATKIVKLIDLSSAIYFNSSQPANRKRIGTSYYIAPEVLERNYNEKCDVWSVGVILYILISGQPPFSGNTDIDVLKNVLYGKLQFSNPIWSKISQSCKNLISKMIERDLKKRLSMADLMLNKWLKQYLKQRQQEQVQTNFIVNSLMNMKKFKEVKQAAIQNGVMIFIMNFVNHCDCQSELLQSFKALDLNGDGKLSQQEMTIGLQKYMQINRSEARIMAQKIFQKVDVNNSGFIDYSQFIQAASQVQVVISQQNIDTAFECFDIDKNGKITVQQFRQKLGKNVSEQQYKKLIKTHDKDNDGVISRQEFKRMMRTLLSQKK